jgi:hypothetical protein
VGENDPELAQQRLLGLLGERAKHPTGSWRHELDARIAELTATLGLDPEEVESLTPQVVANERRPTELVGRFRVHRLAREIMPFWMGLIIGGAVVGLAGPVPGGAVIGLVVLAWLIRSQRRIAVFDIDEAGNIEFKNWGPVEWGAVREVSYHIRHPWFTPKGRRPFVVATAVVRIHADGRRTLRLAQGTLFQTKPTRRAMPYSRLSTLLKARAKSAGMKVQRTDKGEAGWRATRAA